MQFRFACLVALGLAACAPTAPTSGTGAGFQDYPTYLRQREAALNGGGAAPVMPGVPVAGIPGQTSGFSTDRIGSAIDAASGVPAAGQPVPGDQLAGGVGAVIAQTRIASPCLRRRQHLARKMEPWTRTARGEMHPRASSRNRARLTGQQRHFGRTGFQCGGLPRNHR